MLSFFMDTISAYYKSLKNAFYVFQYDGFFFAFILNLYPLLRSNHLFPVRTFTIVKCLRCYSNLGGQSVKSL